jgi:hypothetical protein
MAQGPLTTCRLSDEIMRAKCNWRYPSMEMRDHACTVGPRPPNIAAGTSRHRDAEVALSGKLMPTLRHYSRVMPSS